MNKVLIVENDLVSQELLVEMIQELTKEILFAENGLDAVEICKANKNIDLILMDIKMSGMNGYEATKEIRTFNKDVIIIAQTAYGLLGDEEKSINAGCNDYISKPIDEKLLKEKIEKYLKR
jgi:CheY-like chemotaxis protein